MTADILGPGVDQPPEQRRELLPLLIGEPRERLAHGLAAGSADESHPRLPLLGQRDAGRCV